MYVPSCAVGESLSPGSDGCLSRAAPIQQRAGGYRRGGKTQGGLGLLSGSLEGEEADGSLSGLFTYLRASPDTKNKMKLTTSLYVGSVPAVPPCAEILSLENGIKLDNMLGYFIKLPSF